MLLKDFVNPTDGKAMLFVAVATDRMLRSNFKKVRLLAGPTRLLTCSTPSPDAMIMWKKKQEELTIE